MRDLLRPLLIAIAALMLSTGCAPEAGDPSDSATDPARDIGAPDGLVDPGPPDGQPRDAARPDAGSDRIDAAADAAGAPDSGGEPPPIDAGPDAAAPAACVPELPRCDDAPGRPSATGVFEAFIPPAGRMDAFDLDDMTLRLDLEAGAVELRPGGAFVDPPGSGSRATHTLAGPGVSAFGDQKRAIDLARVFDLAGYPLGGLVVDSQTGIVYLSETPPCTGVAGRQIREQGFETAVPYVVAAASDLELRPGVTVITLDEFDDRVVISIDGIQFSGDPMQTQLRLFDGGVVEMHLRSVVLRSGVTGVVLGGACGGFAAEQDFSAAGP